MAFERAVIRRAAIAGLAVAAAACAVSLEGCASNKSGAKPVFQSQESGTTGGFRLPSFFAKKSDQGGSVSAGAATTPGVIGVNAYLWRASLDTLAFMPLASADPYGGIIITDWYANPEKPDERFKATVYILDTRLRADGLNVTVHRQTRAGPDWRDATTTPATEEAIENAILTRARQIRTGGR